MSDISGHPGKVVMAVIVFLVISQLIYVSGIILSLSSPSSMDYLLIMNPQITSAGGTMPDTGFIFVSLLSGFTASFLFITVYTVLGKALKKSSAARGLEYGLLVYTAGFLPASVYLFLTFTIGGFVILWAIEHLLIYAVGGAVVGFILADNDHEKNSGKNVPGPPAPPKK